MGRLTTAAACVGNYGRVHSVPVTPMAVIIRSTLALPPLRSACCTETEDESATMDLLHNL